MAKNFGGQSQIGKINPKGAMAKGTNPKNRPSKTGTSPANRAFNSMKADGSRAKSTGSSQSVTGGTGSWSGASGTAGGTNGKTFGGSAMAGMKGKKTAYQPNSVKSPSMTGHTAGSMKGNMMGHTNKTTPFQNTGKQPSGAAKPIGNLQHAPLNHGIKSDGGYKAKLQASLPHAMPSTSSWSGASGTQGGMSGKTVGTKMKKGQS